MSERKCVDCGANISSRHYNAKLCLDCYDKRSAYGKSRPADNPTCCACGELIMGEPVWHQGCADTEVNAMRIVCLAAVQWKLAADAVSDFDKNAYTPLPAIIASELTELREEARRRTQLVDARLKAQMVFWDAVTALGWHNQERNRPCPKS